MKDLSRFGTEDYPLHASFLSQIVECPWRAVMQYFSDAESEGGAAADTGSAMHKAAAMWHKGSTVADALEAMRAGTSKYPQADLLDASHLFLKYSADPRNRVECILVEHPVAFEIAAAPWDPTGQPIQVIGTLDQVRRVQGRNSVWDIKTTKKDPIAMNHSYTLQQAAYTIGANILLGEEVEPGGCVYPRRYLQDVARSPVFYHYPWKLGDIEQILMSVRVNVAMIRQRVVWHKPNADCMWCPARTPDVCLPKLRSLKLC